MSWKSPDSAKPFYLNFRGLLYWLRAGIKLGFLCFFFTFNYPMLFLGILIRQTPRECSTWSFKYIHTWSEVKLPSRVRLFATPWTVACQTPPSMEFSRQGYWSGLPFPSPGDLPHPEIEPRPPALQADSLRCEPPGKPYVNIFTHVCKTHN